MEDWSKRSDEQVFAAPSESPGSQFAYYRDTEIRRRLYVLQKESVEAQLDATAAQRSAIREMRRQSFLMAASVIGIFATAVVTLVAAFIGG